jgi:Ca2+-transporting ATPase
VIGDPTEAALLVAARKAGLEAERLNARFARRGEVPFSAERKLMSTIHTDAETAGRVLVFTKGAPDILLTRCTQELVGDGRRDLSDTRRQEILRVNDTLAAARCARSASPFAQSPTERSRPTISASISSGTWCLPADRHDRSAADEARAAVARTIRAGIRPIMITGDHPKTAAVIAQELGFTSEAMQSPAANWSDCPSRRSRKRSARCRFTLASTRSTNCESFQALQRRHAVVAMTGDGVNDAPL